MDQTSRSTADASSSSTSTKSGEWKDLVQTMKVREVAAELKDQATALGSSVITVSKDDNVVQVLHTLTSNRITSAPVYDRQASSFIGLVDVLDLIAFFYRSVNFICSGCKAYEVVSEIVAKEKWNEAEVKIDEADEETLEKIRTTSVSELIGLSERTQWRSVTLDAPLGVLLELLADKDTHRIPITNDDGTSLLGIITQFDVAEWIHAKISTGGLALEHFSRLSVAEFQRKRTPKKLVTVSIKDPMLKALMSIHNNKVMGVAAVDQSGVLQANISANDLRRLPDHDLKQFLKDLFTPVSEFRDPWRLVTCNGNDKIDRVLELMISRMVHRVWIVDATNKPSGVVSLCDVIGEFCTGSGYCA